MNMRVTVTLIRQGRVLAMEHVVSTIPEEADAAIDMAQFCARAALLKAWKPVAEEQTKEQQQAG